LRLLIKQNRLKSNTKINFKSFLQNKKQMIL